MINDMTRMIATNVIYFKGLWQSAFNPQMTKLRDFTLNNKTKIKVPMMMQTSHFDYTQNDHAQMIILPYRNSSLAMAILLPKTNTSLAALTNTVNYSMIHQMLSSA